MDTEARMKRLQDAFNKCIDGKTKESSLKVFGVDNFPALIGKKFCFFVEDYRILVDKSDEPDEAFVGQVTGMNFRLLKHLIKLPEETKSVEKYLSGLESISEVDGACYPIIRTTIGLLRPPWSSNLFWQLVLDDSRCMREWVLEGIAVFFS